MKESLILLLFVFTIPAGMSKPQRSDVDWTHGITLLQTTKTDVERLFGKPVGPNYGVTYTLKDGILYLNYYDFDHCKSQGRFDARWNVPEWTVTEVEFRPDEPPAFASLHLNLKRLRKAHLNPHTPDLLSYFDDQNGIEYTVDESNGTLNNVRYFPGARYERFRCPK